MSCTIINNSEDLLESLCVKLFGELIRPIMQCLINKDVKTEQFTSEDVEEKTDLMLSEVNSLLYSLEDKSLLKQVSSRFNRGRDYNYHWEYMPDCFLSVFIKKTEKTISDLQRELNALQKGLYTCNCNPKKLFNGDEFEEMTYMCVECESILFENEDTKNFQTEEIAFVEADIHSNQEMLDIATKI